MRRRQFLQCSLVAGLSSRLWAAVDSDGLDEAERILREATKSGQVKAATLHVVRRGNTVTRAFGERTDANSMFLLGSISKPICVAALMTLFDQNEFRLDDPLSKFLPKFTGEGRERVTLRQLLTHTSGLQDQLANNNELRRSHAGLTEFVDHAVRAPLSFSPGSKYQYSSMGILLATEVAATISGKAIPAFVNDTVFRPLKMDRSAQGLGRFSLEELVPTQIEFAAPEAGGGDPTAKD